MILNSEHTNNVDNIDKNKNYYVVKKGYSPGIYINWEDCKAQVNV